MGLEEQPYHDVSILYICIQYSFMKKIFTLSILLFTVFFVKAQTTDSVKAKVHKLTDLYYELEPRIGHTTLGEYIGNQIPVPDGVSSSLEDEATVVLHIDSNGRPSDLRLFKSFSPVADNSIRNAFNSLTMVQPAYSNGHPIAVNMIYSVKFQKTSYNDTLKAYCWADDPGTFRDNDSNQHSFMAPDNFASFPGGTAAFFKFLKKNIVYPPEARAKKIQGKVVIVFEVQRDGSLGDLHVTSSPDDDLTKEAIRVLHSCPKFTPVVINGEAMYRMYQLPINFTLPKL
jgi:TonB family protein